MRTLIHQGEAVTYRIIGGLLLGVMTMTAQARVASETVYFLQPDGQHYLLERALRTPASSHRFYVDKNVRRKDLRHVEPKAFGWDAKSRDDVNILSFDQGGFTLIFPGSLRKPHLEKQKNNEYLFRSWDGEKNADGRFGIWYSPDDFDDFTYTWIFPDNITLLSYRSNRDGEWVKRANAISFFATDVNNLTFELRYRVAPPASGARPAATVPSACPEQPEAAPAPVVVKQACPEPAAVVSTDAGGCQLDCDADGIPNLRDRCPATVAGGAVDTNGCVTRNSGDADQDGVNDARDLCLGTASGATVDRAGCSLDTDKDGVPDGIDQCIATIEESTVDHRGCATDAAD